MRPLARFLFLLGLVVTCLALLLFLDVIPTRAVTKHGCASPTPPAVAGSLSQPSASAGIIVMNEVLLEPHSTWNCSELGSYTALNDTWLELYNPQNEPFDLYAVHANLDSGPNTNAFYLPFGSAIPANSYLVLFPRTDPNFVSTETSTWRLLFGGTLIDELKLPALGEDQSYARIPDGGSTWQVTTTPTIGASNALQPVPSTRTTRNTGTGSQSGTGTSHGTGSSSGSGQSGSGSGGYGTGGGTSSSGSVGSDGQQPSWNKLHQSAATATTSQRSTSATGTIGSPFATTPLTSPFDIPRKIVLTVLVCALALACVWCWKLFHSSR